MRIYSEEKRAESREERKESGKKKFVKRKNNGM
jgi:hypothetical protein